MTVGSTNENVRIKLIPAYLRYADHWESGFEELDGDMPTYGIYESESTHERYSGYRSVRFGSTVPPDLRRYIRLEPIASEINLTEGEILKLIEVIPLNLSRKLRKINKKRKT